MGGACAWCMTLKRDYDAIVVGSGPNGLAAACTLASEGYSVLVVEGDEHPGGGTRSAELTLPGIVHDRCSAVHPTAIASPIFRKLALEQYGLRWVQPSAPLVHVRADGSALVMERSLHDTARALGRDGEAYEKLMEPFVRRFDTWIEMVLGPLRPPRAPLLFAHFGLHAMRSVRGLARTRFVEPDAPALLGGISAHAMVPLTAPVSAAFGLMLGVTAHAAGWPVAQGGSQAIANALLACLRAHGGEIVCGTPVRSLDQLPSARVYLLSVTPDQLGAIAGDRLSATYRRRIARFRYGPGVFKMDWALHGPIPWRDPACLRAATVHLSGDLSRLIASEEAMRRGGIAELPFVLLAQPSLFDSTRAPNGMHTVWAYCHVPNGSALDATEQIERHIGLFAPGFRERIAARHTANAQDKQHENPNYVGGDINGGISDLTQLFFRPVARVDPYSTPSPDLFICSSSTPPGGGVHGMCGYWAARSALARLRR